MMDTGGGGGASSPTATMSRWKFAAWRQFQHLLDKSTPHVGRRWLGFAAVALLYALRVYLVQGFYVVSYGLGIYILNLLIGFLSPQVDPETVILDADVPTLPSTASDEFRPFVRRLPEFKFCQDVEVCGLSALPLWPDLATIFCVVLRIVMKWHVCLQPQQFKTLVFCMIIAGAYLALTVQSRKGRLVLGWLKGWYSITKAFCIAFVMTFFSAFDVPVFWPILLFYWVVLFSLTMRRQISHMIKYKYLPFSSGKQMEQSEDLMEVEESCF
ncbi:Protein RER1A [Glycine soja]